MSLFGQISSSLSPVSGKTGAEASSPAQVAVTDLKNGSTVSGTVKNIDGNDVTIKLPDGRELQAKLDGGLALKEGQNVTFGIRSGSDARIALTPLYTNMSQGITAQNALASAVEMAGTACALTTVLPLLLSVMKMIGALT